MSEKTLSSDNSNGTNRLGGLTVKTVSASTTPSSAPQGALSHSGQSTSNRHIYDEMEDEEEEWSEEPPDGADGRGKMVKTTHGVKDTKGGNGTAGSQAGAR